MASRGVNKVILVGNLGSDPDVRYMPSGDAITNISIATSETWKDKQTGEPRERTEWHRVVFFRGLAGVAGEYLKKGSKVYVEGSLRTRKWQGQDGQDRYSTEIVASDMQMLDSRGGGTANFNDNSVAYAPSNQASAPVAPQQPAESQQPPTPTPSSSADPMDDFDDDIPF